MMRCPSGCRCGRHKIGPQIRQQNHLPRNTTFMPSREHYSSTYGEAQRERMVRVNAERRQRLVMFNDRPSTRFDWDAAIAGLYRMFDQVYGPRWRNGLRGVE